MYCIKHEKMTFSEDLYNSVYSDIYKPRQLPIGYVHLERIYMGGDAPDEAEWCDFDMGWATCPPPEPEETFEEWLESIEEYQPDDDELDEINIKAQELMIDLGILT